MPPLSVHSFYSLMWGVNSPRQLCQAAKAHGYTHIALTDVDNLYGLWPFLSACREAGLTPIVGAELTDPSGPGRAVCLVQNDAGYRNLCRLITRRHCARDFNLAAALGSYARGLIILSSHIALLVKLRSMGLDVWAALRRKPDGPAWRLRQAARDLNAPAAVVPDAYFLQPEEFKIHRVLRAIALNTSLSRLPPAHTAHPDAWLAPPCEYRRRFAVWPDALEGAEKLIQRLSFTAPKADVVMPPWKTDSTQSAAGLLRTAAYDGARKRYGDDLPENVVDRLEHELKIIEAKGFSSYFLVVRDIVRRSPRICGRGSGAASLAAYCLEITNVCPVKHNLYFERFLNPGRSDPPDIDVDFAWDERDQVIASVLAQYRDHSALVCNHVTMQPRLAIRETAKVYGLPQGEIGRISKRLPWFWRKRFQDADLFENLKQLPELGCPDLSAPWPEIIQIAQRIIGAPRCLSVHPGGVVITPNPLDEYVPIQKAPKGVPIIQWEKDSAEEAGLVKIDLLGNRSLGVIRDAIANLRANGEPWNELRWEPEEDAATRATVANGETMGCFYIESPAMRLLQKKTRAGDFEHLVIHSSIIRPAANECIREYIRRLHGDAWEPIHPLLADVLDETLGIMVYQEDVAKTAVAVAGFSHTDADGLRKIMSKKSKHRKLQHYHRQFTQGAQERGLTRTQIDQIWEMMMSFSGYSFCKPHSASYARVSFQAAYLKTHFPAEFMAAVISNQGGFYSAFAYVSEARRMGVAILAPDVNHSWIRWRGVNRVMRVGFMSIRRLSAETQQRIITARRSGAYTHIGDFLQRVHPDETEARMLIHAGAFDALHPRSSRAALLWELACWRKRNVRRSKQPDLFASARSHPQPLFPPENRVTRLRNEYSALGFLCDRHPMTLYADILKRVNIIKMADLARWRGRWVYCAGILITGKVVHTKHGDPMQFLTFEDETGLVEATFFPQAYRRFCALLEWGHAFGLYGQVDEDFGAVTLIVKHAERLKY